MTTEPDDNDDVDARVIAPLRRAKLAVDDIHAARMAAGIEAGLDTRAAARAQPRWQLLGLASVCALGAAAVVAVMAVRGDAQRATHVPRPVALAPYVYVGPGAEAARLSPAARLSVPAGAKLRASAGTAVRLTLVGPGAVAASTVDGVTELALDGGLLLVDFDHNADGKLRVRAPGVVVTVVGTLFAVDARDGGARVAVMRGAIDVDAAAGRRRLVAGSAWASGDGDARPILPALAAALAEHDASPPPPVGDYVVVDERALGDPPLVARVASGSRAARNRPAARTVDQAPPLAAPLEAPAPAAGTAPAPLAPDSNASPLAPGSEAEALYAAAEVQMRAGANQQARATLRELVARHGGDPRSEAALLDLARLSLAAGATDDARRFLARLPDPTRDRALVEPARHLRCRVDVAAGAMASAASCLRAFRGQHPSSPHDAEVLAQLAAITDDCARARPLLDEYLRRYPAGAFAAQARERQRQCRPSP